MVKLPFFPSSHHIQYMLIAQSREELLPDPAKDSVSVVFYCLQNGNETLFPTNGLKRGYHIGIIMIQDENSFSRMGLTGDGA